MAFKRSGVRFPSPPFSDETGALDRVRIHRVKATLIQASEVAGIAQLVEHNLAKVGVAGSSPVSRSDITSRISSVSRTGG